LSYGFAAINFFKLIHLSCFHMYINTCKQVLLGFVGSTAKPAEACGLLYSC
jgi:hypothetical protein